MEKAKNKPTCLQFVLFICLFRWSFEVLLWLLHILTLFAKIQTSINGFLFYFAALCLFVSLSEIFEEIKWWWWRWRWERSCNIFSKKICIWYAKCHATMFFLAEMSCRKEMCLFEYLKLHSFSISLPCFTCSLSRISHCKVLCTLSTVFHRYTRLTLAAHIQRREFRTS